MGAGGKYFIRPNEIGGWYTQSVTVGGKDYTDRIFELREDTTSIVVTLTDRPTRVAGTVKDVRGATTGTAVVLAFPVDRQRWVGYGREPRDLVSAVTSGTGGYAISNLPPGDYYLIAVESRDADEWQDPKLLELMATRAQKITVAAGDAARTVDLTVSRIR